MTTIKYKKTFLTGNLATMTVECSLEVPTAVAAYRRAEIARATHKHPAKDLISKAYWVASEVR